MPSAKFGLVSRTYRHINRYRQILTVLVRYGFEGLVERLRIGRYVEAGLHLISREKRPQLETLTTAQRVRLMLEELGPTFIKLGQVLSTRPDLVPPSWVEELARLQQHVPPFPFEQVREIVRSGLGRPIEQVYRYFDEQPVAAASIGQVHRATLRDGPEVVVKVQRPNIKSVIDVDLEILHHLAHLAERHLEGWKVYRPTRIVEEFRRVIERELDFAVEAAHLERFAANFRGDGTIYVPKVFRAASSQRVLTLEYVEVVPVTDVAALESAGFDPKLIAARGAHVTLRMIFEHGFFHADPHPGNCFVLPGNVICLLDFGMMGRLDRTAREHFADLIYAVAAHDPVRTASALLRITRPDEGHEVDSRALERDLDEFIDLNIPATLKELRFSRLLHELLALVARHRLAIPADLVMMMKAAATAETLVSRLDPDLNLIAVAEPYIRRLKAERLRPARLFRDAVELAAQTLELGREIPSGLRELLRLARRGALRIGFEHRGLDRMLEVHERIANRVSFAIVVAALIVGSSLIVHSRLPPTWHEIPVVGLIGYLAAGAMGVMLLVAIIRHGRL